MGTLLARRADLLDDAAEFSVRRYTFTDQREDSAEAAELNAPVRGR
jgi:hypothetical protein